MSKDVEMRREEWPARFWDWLDSPGLARWFEGMPMLRDTDRLRIEEEITDDTMIVRAEMPGIDPEKDVAITVTDGVLTIRAERQQQQRREQGEGRTRSEFRYGSFARSVRLPADVSADDVTASYQDGILEVRYPCKVPTEAAPRTIPVSRP